MKVFIDANLIIQTGKPPGGPLFSRVIDLVNAGYVTVVTTDLTISEVAKKHTLNDFEVVKEVGRPHFRKLLHELFNVDLPDFGKDDIREMLSKKYLAETEKMFAALKAKILTIDDIKPSVVFNSYSAAKGFFAGESKRDQFPDAFIFECLKAEGTAESPLTLVTDDRDFTAPSREIEHLVIVKSIPDLFKKLGFEVEAPDLNEFLEAQAADLRSKIEADLDGWELGASDIVDADIDIEKLDAFDLSDLTVFKPVDREDFILLTGTASVTLSVTYRHPDWENGYRDPDDRSWMPYGTVEGETTITIIEKFSMAIEPDEDGKPLAINELSFRNSFFHVDIQPDDGWPYK
ncbi:MULTISPECIES: PIN domain-containing protein [unclassified Mesorhizobium]|uniref:PIN domain-containing protein n=1 Tax=unclassified Mesorhizobium TaxID=325217 RepID=UPI003014371F